MLKRLLNFITSRKEKASYRSVPVFRHFNGNGIEYSVTRLSRPQDHILVRLSGYLGNDWTNLVDDIKSFDANRSKHKPVVRFEFEAKSYLDINGLAHLMLLKRNGYSIALSGNERAEHASDVANLNKISMLPYLNKEDLEREYRQTA